MSGSVIIFNATIQEVDLNLNGKPLQSIKAATPKWQYTPLSSNPISRTEATGPGTETEFGENNHLIVTYGSNSHMFAVTIDPTIAPLGKDLQLYLFYSDPVLIMGGSVIKNGITQKY